MESKIEQSISQSNENLVNKASNDAIFDAQSNTWDEVLKITKMWWFTQIILATLEKITDPAWKIKELQEARANLCKTDPEDCSNDDIYKKIA